MTNISVKQLSIKKKIKKVIIIDQEWLIVDGL